MMPRRMARLVAAVAFALGAAAHSAAQSPAAQPATAATAGDAQLEARTRELAAELRCPVCQGISIQDSPAELAKDMRAVVREQLRAGQTPEQVKAYFVGRYGEWILLRPKAQGFNWVVYLLPLLALAIGGAALGLVVRRWRRSAARTAAVPAQTPR